MENFVENLYKNMLSELDEVATVVDNPIQKADKSYHVVESIMKELKAYVLDKDFRDKPEEIKFFKFIKPKFQSELFYYLQIFYFEYRKPLGNVEMIKNFHHSALLRVDDFFDKNLEFYNYFRLGRTENDEWYFIRGAESTGMMPKYSLDHDSRFSTPYSLKLAEMMSMDMFKDFIHSSLSSLDFGKGSDTSSSKMPQLHWTDNNVGLVEIITAIHVNKSVNGGNISFQKLVNAFESLFNMDLRHVHRYLQNMRIRKKSRTPYLRKSIEKVEQYMDDVDMRW